MSLNFETTDVLGMPYAELNENEATGVIASWASKDEHRTVGVVPVSSIMMGKSDKQLTDAYEHCDLIASDGVPIVWMRKALGRPSATRLYGPDLMLSVCKRCAEDGIAIGLLGGRPERLQGLMTNLNQRFPELRISYAYSPPFRVMSEAEIAGTACDIKRSGARVLFVGMGCPKQEILMQQMKPMLPCVQLGVGAAFDFIPGYVKQAPRWLQRAGMEWAYRVACEPRRLWKRYATTLPPFVVQACAQVLAHKVKSCVNQMTPGRKVAS